MERFQNTYEGKDVISKLFSMHLCRERHMHMSSVLFCGYCFVNIMLCSLPFSPMCMGGGNGLVPVVIPHCFKLLHTIRGLILPWLIQLLPCWWVFRRLNFQLSQAVLWLMPFEWAHELNNFLRVSIARSNGMCNLVLGRCRCPSVGCLWGFLGGSVVENLPANAGVSGKIPWRRKWQPSPVVLPGKSHGQRNLVD